MGTIKYINLLIKRNQGTLFSQFDSLGGIVREDSLSLKMKQESVGNDEENVQ